MKILVIQSKMIGDVLTSSILFEALREKFPNARLVFAINNSTKPVVENNPFIDDLITLDASEDGESPGLLQNSIRIRKEKFDVVIDAYGKISSNLISFFSGAKKRISKHKYYTFFLYSDAVIYNKYPKSKAGLAIENRLQLLNPLGINPANPIRPKIYLTDAEINNAEQQLKSFHVDLNHPVFMISALGSSDSKTYPLVYMASVIDHIVEITGGAILLNYIPNQAPDIEKLIKLCSPSTRGKIIPELYGKSLRNFLALTSFCTALIGNEGGAVNMAKALSIPTFTIFSPWIDKLTWSIFEGDDHVSVHLIDFDHDVYKGCHVSDFKKESLPLYQRFKPELFLDHLTQYLNRFKDKNA
ncbi:MAG: glycosyltransferase family 9 protein [Flavobacteriaceae bacterium]|nr:glycosyltransferase family 9 protein [Flavobacteriaceae bacterium]